MARQAAQQVAMLRAVGPPRPAVEEHVVEVAARWPDRWRLEGRWFWHGPGLVVIDGASWMAWSPEEGATSNFGDANASHGNPAGDMLNPAPLLRSEIDDVVVSEVYDRPTWRLRAWPLDRRSHFEALGRRASHRRLPGACGPGHGASAVVVGRVGQVLEVYAADPQQGGSDRVRMVRDGIHLEVAGELPADKLIRLLLSVIPAATELSPAPPS